MALTPEQLAASGTEHGHQTAYFAALVPLWASFPQARWIHAIPNGGERDVIVAGRLKAEGVRQGVWDVCIPVACGPYHGGYLEFKKPSRRKEERGGLTESQWAFGMAMHDGGYFTAVVYTWEEALLATERYLALNFFASSGN